MSEGPDASWRRTLNHVLTAVKKIESIFARFILTTPCFLERWRSFTADEKLAASARPSRTEISWAAKVGRRNGEVHVLAAPIRSHVARGSQEKFKRAETRFHSTFTRPARVGWSPFSGSSRWLMAWRRVLVASRSGDKLAQGGNRGEVDQRKVHPLGRSLFRVNA